MHCVQVGSLPSHLIFFRLGIDYISVESSQRRGNGPAALTSPPNSASLDMEGLSIGEGWLADADTFLLLRGGFGGHGG